MDALSTTDTPHLRKARGAYFTPDLITRFVARWALRSMGDRVLEPSAGDAAFMVAAVERLAELGAAEPVVDGVELHEASTKVARARVMEAGGRPRVRHSDFFLVNPEPTFDAVIGNPPYIRYQGFSGEARARSREAALRAGVALTGLASSWAAFTIHSALFLKEGGRLGLVLPAELLTVNYAAPVRRFLFDHFRDVQLVRFDEQVFPEAEADVVLLLADGYGQGPTDHAIFRQARNAEQLGVMTTGQPWKPADPSGKWTASLVDAGAMDVFRELANCGKFTTLSAWGETKLGIVTGSNNYFTLSPARVEELGLNRKELLRLSPPGSSHLRGLTLTTADLKRLGGDGKPIYLFHPGDRPSEAAAAYIEDGYRAGVANAYKCRVRKVWFRVPIVAPADLMLTYMNADTPRLTTNEAGAHHLNSVHGVYLHDAVRRLGRDLLPIASLNSVTLLSAEMVGRAYGGGILKVEPREADVWAMPSPELVSAAAEALRGIRRTVARHLATGQLTRAVELVDQVLLCDSYAGGITPRRLDLVREAHRALSDRRTLRGASGRQGNG
ncbi:methyltransferase [Tessaracoccus lapidicaptus]|uniref:site-specific DNA-methyltransferase (adenine-specific) n=1 Tax=Tessaracoccus lapidicaptus TaxID=1427523 RepID=A0A1C0AGQ3_9ACTN|nr:N-6 DNA methylase [Tessaracoccus lapidicaptus]OCL30871.1 methyltransferase [Tessaracoccus lapidicaptus]